jgi:outer membrane scaffolding protein for murein synthesis (MipA/OmpV family)
VTTFSVHKDPQSRGRFATTPLQYQWLSGSAYNRYNKISIKVGPMFGSDANHDYYYRVQERYATAERPKYNPEGGFGGMGYLLSYTRRTENVWMTTFVKYEDLSRAVFADSPLMKTTNYWSCGIFMAYIITSARTPVEKDQ